MLIRKDTNVVVVALAAKLAPIVWALLRRETTYNQGATIGV